MRLPGPEAHPAEVGLAALVLANHVVAAAVLQGVKLREDSQDFTFSMVAPHLGHSFVLAEIQLLVSLHKLC